MITVLSYNVRQWSRDTNPKKAGYWKDRAARIRNLIERENPDIILLQEAIFPMVGKIIPDGYKKATGCSISHHIYCRDTYRVLKHEWHMRWCRAMIETPDRAVNAISIHTHWDENIYRKTCTEISSRLQGGYLNFAGGDWNNTPDIIRPLVQPMGIVNTNTDTFRNWETGKQAELDFFAVWPKQGTVTTFGNFGWDSDHKPVILTV